MIIGNLQRRWQESRPEVYDKETHIVCLDIVREDITIEGVVTEGYSFIPVEIDDQIDYGHIKSQLIEAGFAQNRSKNHGLANLDFRNYLLFYTMAKYGWRDSQNCKTSDGTLVWGCGLDGSENTTVRLSYYGTIRQVSSSKLAELSA